MSNVKCVLFTAVVVAAALAQSGANAQPQEKADERPFVERLVLNPQETCSKGAPGPGETVALSLRGAKGLNYMRAAPSDEARVAVRGPASSAFSVFQITETATPKAVAFLNVGKAKFLQLDDRKRVAATAEPASAASFVFEETGDGYVRIRQAGQSAWMQMNVNGYLDFRARSAQAAVQFCVQPVRAE
jgi:hypothetical protein